MRYLQKPSRRSFRPRLDRFYPSQIAPLKWLWCGIVVIFLGYWVTSPGLLLARRTIQTEEAGMITLEFRYHLPEAGEVFFLWGVNGWHWLPEELRPAGTQIDGVMYLLMKPKGEDTFVVKVQVPAGTPLDYGFQTRTARTGPLSEWVWDGDYRLIPAKDDVIEVEAAVTLSPGQTPQSSADAPLVTLKFRYHMPEAGEVVFIWGVNGWQWVPEELRPAGTGVDGVMYTPMKVKGDTFVMKVQVPAGTSLDYGFQIRKKRTGTPIEWVWDGDYQLTPSKDDIIEVQPAVSLAQARQLPLDFDIGLDLLMIVSFTFGILLTLEHALSLVDRQKPLPPAVTILGSGISLYFFLILIRANILGFNWISMRYSLPFVPDILAAGYYDLLYVGAITLLFLGFLLLFRQKQKAQRLLPLIYSGVALVSLLIAFVNIQVVQMLGRPFNYQWLYYSDFLLSAEARSAIFANISSDFLLNAVTLCGAMVIVSRLLLHGFSFLPKFSSHRPILIATVVPLFVYLPVANWYIKTNDWDYPKLVNPITAFLESVIAAQTYPVLITMRLSEEDLAEFQGVTASPLETVSLSPQANTKVKNVIVFVMESVAAEYIEGYGGVYPVTPELNQARQQSLLFNNIYAHAPASNKSLVSILSSIYPWLSYYSLTQKYPEINLPTLSSELKKYNYRTAFLSAGDTHFQRGHEFLAHRQFDKLADYDDLDCDRQKFDLDWSFSDGVDEECLVDAFGAWQSESPEQPFFVMMWTVGTHYPYFVVGEEVNYGVKDPALNRYLNAVHHSDKVVGQLLRTLESKGLLESTLLVIVGDHGEAFGRHGQIGHASRIYEENVHVPLILINPTLFSGEENPTIGGHVDIGPTIMHLLNLPTPAGWQGRSLLSQDRSGRTYFFSPWSDFLFGYREDNLKVIFNATNSNNEIYNLATDPQETTNLANQRSDIISVGHRHLAAWVQSQDKFIKELLSQQK